MASKDRAQAALVKAYAEEKGLSLRTAQRHRNGNHPDWQRYVNHQAGSAIATPTIEAAASLVAVPVLAYDDDVSQMGQVERHHWEMWRRTCVDWGAEENAVTRAGLARVIIELRKDYEKARDSREAADIAERRLIPAGEFQSMMQNFVIPLRNLLDNIAPELAGRVNQADPDHARSEIEDWKLNRLQPAIQEMIDGLDAVA